MPQEHDVEVTNNTIRLWRKALKRAEETNHEGMINCAKLHIKIYQAVREHHGYDELPDDGKLPDTLPHKRSDDS